MDFFVLSWRHHEGKCEYHFISENTMTDEEFNSLCNELAPIAAERLLEKHTKNQYPIGWLEIVDEIAVILVNDHGFTKITPKKCVFTGGWVISDHYKNIGDEILGEKREAVAHHNDTSIWDAHPQAVS
jgi:hypothetical protein